MAFKCGLFEQRRLPLHDPQIRAAEHTDLAVGPGLARDPVQRVVAILWLLAERIEYAFGFVAAAHVLDDHGVAVVDERTVIGRQVIALAIRRAHQDRRETRAVSEGRKTLAASCTPSRMGIRTCRRSTISGDAHGGEATQQ